MRLALRCPLSVVLCQRLFVNPGACSRTRISCWGSFALKLYLKPLSPSLLALCSSWYRSLDSCPACLTTPLFACTPSFQCQPHTRTHSHTLWHVLRVSSVINYYVSSPHLWTHHLPRACVCVCVFVESTQFRIPRHETWLTGSIWGVCICLYLVSLFFVLYSPLSILGFNNVLISCWYWKLFAMITD